MNCQRAEVSHLLICRHRNSGFTLVPQIGHNVCVSSVVRFRSRALSPTPNVERRYKLWTTPHRTIEETFCCALGRVNRYLIYDLSQVVRYFALTSPSPLLAKRWPCSVLLFQVVRCDMSRCNKVVK
jgi:hypothetical protein